MNKTAKPRIGGILSIISGVLGLLGIISYSIGLGDAGSGFGKGVESRWGRETIIRMDPATRLRC